MGNQNTFVIRKVRQNHMRVQTGMSNFDFANLPNYVIFDQINFIIHGTLHLK